MEKFFADKAKRSPQTSTSERKEEEEQDHRKPIFPKGVVLGKDGKPYLPPFFLSVCPQWRRRVCVVVMVVV